MATIFQGGQWCLRCFIDDDEKGPHLWHGRAGGGALQLGTSVEQSSMGVINVLQFVVMKFCPQPKIYLFYLYA
jgi:hypothetical protein